MLLNLTVLLVYQLVGEVLARLFGWPIPGPVVGMALLFATLLARGAVSEDMERTANGLLKHLSLLFVPAGVGVMVYLPLVAREWLPLTVAVVGGTLVSIAVTGLTMKLILGRGR